MPLRGALRRKMQKSPSRVFYEAKEKEAFEKAYHKAKVESAKRRGKLKGSRPSLSSRAGKGVAGLFYPEKQRKKARKRRAVRRRDPYDDFFGF